MTRRERHENIIRMFGGMESHYPSWATRKVLGRMGISAFTDEAIAQIAEQAASDRAFNEKLNRSNRALRHRTSQQ